VIEGSDLRIYFGIAGFAIFARRPGVLLAFRAGAISALPRCVPSKANELAARLKRFATRIVIFARAMPTDPSSQVLARQLTGSGTAQSANYHAARRGRSRAEFIAKLGVAAEEADETEHWLIVIRDAHIISTTAGLKELDWLLDEGRQLRAILVASTRTARANHRNHQ
jgi:four helix bundle protein